MRKLYTLCRKLIAERNGKAEMKKIFSGMGIKE